MERERIPVEREKNLDTDSNYFNIHHFFGNTSFNIDRQKDEKVLFCSHSPYVFAKHVIDIPSLWQFHLISSLMIV